MAAVSGDSVQPPAVTPEDSADKLTADEAEQYDRQIRLWGLEAQKRLRSSHILVVGVKGLGAEVAKNIVLAGVREVTLLDHTPLETGDSACRFLMQEEGVNRAEQAVQRLRTLNPNVALSAEVERVEEKNADYFSKFDVVIATCCTTEQLVRMDVVCREQQTKFFCGDVWGYYGYFFTDLGEHQYAMEIETKETEDVMTLEGPKEKRSKSEPEMVTVKETCSFCSLQDALSVDWGKKPAKYFRRTPPTFLLIQSLQQFRDQKGSDPTTSSSDRDSLEQIRQEVASKYNLGPELIPANLHQWCVSELSPVCAVVGGVLAQEVIKALSAKDRPYTNSFLYDGQQGTGIIELLRP